MRAFLLIPLAVCIYEIASLILPLRLPLWGRILAYLILLSGLLKGMLYRRTPTGFEIIELPYGVSLLLTLVFNFIIIAFFILLVKDAFFISWKIFSRVKFPEYYASLFAFSLALCATLYGTYEGLKLPSVVTHEVSIKNLGSEFENFRIAMLVDIHADELTNHDAVQKIVDRTNSLNPDLILIPGDFVDGTVKARRHDLEPLKNLKAKFGVFGVTGNHEYYFDFEGWIKEIPALGVRLLNNEKIILTSGDSKLIIAGLPDITGGLAGRDLEETLKDVPEDSPIILMDHQPRNARENAKYKNIVLQLSGHTHGGQIPVMYQIVKRANKGFVRGWYDIDGGSPAGNMKLFVSPGTSQWNGFACRLFDPSEISLFILHASI
ncbi:MAG: metallophosphoesterase [Synergistaceae bacterium]|nr:metallophosphoesterase [Synergistaceae bacterium]